MPVIAILRGLPPQRTVALAERCWDAGIELVEVPVQRSEGLAALEAAAAAAARREWFVGAGTVSDVYQARRCRDVGARFLVAPGLDRDTVEATREWALPYLPGVLTPSEVQLALRLGVSTMKFFPAGALGPRWIGSMRGPFPQVGFVAVGGVTAANGQAFLDAGAVGVGVGSALGSSEAVAELTALRHHTDPTDMPEPTEAGGSTT